MRRPLEKSAPALIASPKRGLIEGEFVVSGVKPAKPAIRRTRSPRTMPWTGLRLSHGLAELFWRLFGVASLCAVAIVVVALWVAAKA